jgi:hypothetical protein
MFEKEGLTLIPPRAGAELVVDEARNASAHDPVEIVVMAEPHPTLSHPRWNPIPAPEPGAVRKLELAFRRKVSVDLVPVLASHVIDGRAVLPMALMLEWLTEGAIQRNPGLAVCGVDHLRLFKGVILDDREEAIVEILAGKCRREGPSFIVPMELRGSHGKGREVAHARADVVLGDRQPSSTRRLSDRALSRYPHAADVFYGRVLFHGRAMQGIQQVEGWSDSAIAGWAWTSPQPSEWMMRPSRTRWLTDPLAIDCAFQLIVLWSREQLAANSLPSVLGSYRQFRSEFPAEGVRIRAEIRQASAARAVADIEILDHSGELVARLDSYECVVDPSLNQTFRRNQFIPPVSVVSS